MDYHSLPRKDLQLLCKKHGIPANKTNVFMAEALAKKRIPLSDVNVNKEAENDLFSVTPSKVSAAKSKGDNGDAALFNNTPFLRRGSKRRESVICRNADVTEEKKEVATAPPSWGTRLFPQSENDLIPESATKAGAAVQNASAKDSSGTLPRGEKESKSCRAGPTAKGSTGPVKQKPEEKACVPLKPAAGHIQHSESRRGKSISLKGGTQAVSEKTEVKPFTSSGAATGALQPDESRIGVWETSANPNLAAKGKRNGKNSSFQSPISEQEESESRSSATSEIRVSSSEGTLTSVKEQEEIKSETVDDTAKEASFVDAAAHEEQTYLGEDSNTEYDQQEGSEPQRPDTPPKERYIVKVTFASPLNQGPNGEKARLEETKARKTYTSVSFAEPLIQGSSGEKAKLEETKARKTDISVTFAEPFIQGSSGEKVRLEETKARKTDTSAANAGYAVKSRWDSKPAPTQPFVFGATRQEETKPVEKRKMSKCAARETSDVKGHADPKASVAGGLKQDDSKSRRAAPEVKEAAVVKVKTEAKASAVPVANSYSKPSKRPRLDVGAKAVNDSKGNVERGDRRSASTEPEVVENTVEFPATCSEEFKVLDLPEWAKEFKRKRGDTLSSTSPVAQSPERPTEEETAVVTAAGLSPLKRIEDRVVKLLDRLKGFCWKAEVADISPETEATCSALIPAEEADHIEVEYTGIQPGEETD